MLNFKVNNINKLCNDYSNTDKNRKKLLVTLSGLTVKNNQLLLSINPKSWVKTVTKAVPFDVSGTYYSGRNALHNFMNSLIFDKLITSLDLQTTEYVKSKVYPYYSDDNRDNSTVCWIDDSGHTRTESKNLMKNH